MTGIISAMRSIGIEADREPLPDGNIKRYPVIGKNSKNKNGWCICSSLNGKTFAVFGRWDTGEKIKWSNGDQTKYDDTEFDKLRQKYKKDELGRNEKAKKAACAIWPKRIISNHKYLIDKGLKNKSGPQYNGALIIPIYDSENQLVNLQRIYPDGSKKFLYGGKIKGCASVIQGNAEKICIAEGYATAATINEATGYRVVIAFNAGNILPVAKNIRAKYRSAAIIICGDNDESKTGEKYGKTAAESVGGTFVMPPIIGNDFNDYAKSNGIDAVSAIINSVSIYDIPPLTMGDTHVKNYLTEKPPDRKFILTYNDDGLLQAGILGCIVAEGGTGKSRLMNMLSMVLTGHMRMPPFFAPYDSMTLLLNFEDSQDELNHRFWDLTDGHFPDLFFARSMVGKTGPLMKLDNGNLTPSKWFFWLDDTLKNHPNLKVLILDPYSRLLGVDENKSEYSTYFCNCMEGLSQKYGINILIVHHTNKASSEKPGPMDQNMSRGSNGLMSAVRWGMGMRKMTEADANKYQIQNRREYVELANIKNNATREMPGSLFFKSTDNGGFVHVDPAKDIFMDMASTMLKLIFDSDTRFTRRELKRSGNPIASEMIDCFPKFKKSRDIDNIINYLLEKGYLIEKEFRMGKTNKNILVPNQLTPPS